MPAEGSPFFRDASTLTYGFVGLGLMGGSLAQAIRQMVLRPSSSVANRASQTTTVVSADDTSLLVTETQSVGNAVCMPKLSGRIFACDLGKFTLEKAKASGVIDESFLPDNVDNMLASCDVVFICLYPHATCEFLLNHESAFKSGSIVTDISGVKAELVKCLDKIHRTDIDIIPGHPMAGSEREGYSYASEKIFSGRNYLFMRRDSTKTDNLEFLKKLARSIGFTRIIETTPNVHDHKIAFTSQLCHVIASALVDSAEDTKITEFGGGSFEDLTRIALINAPLWTELFLSNKKELITHIESFEKSLDELKALIKSGDETSLCQMLNQVRETRQKMV